MIICLCGSKRFVAEFKEASETLTLAGHVVLAPVIVKIPGLGSPTDKDMAVLSMVHGKKIDMADLVIIINKHTNETLSTTYIGAHTEAEIKYAKASGKPVFMWSLVHDNPERLLNT